MTRNAGFRWLRGLAGLAGLAGALAGVPLGLIALGQGLPGGVGTWHELVTGLRRPLTDTTLLRGAGLLCWLLWACFAVAIGIEIVGYLRAAGRPRPRWAAVPGLQTWARTLVLTAALLLPQRNLVVSVAAEHRVPSVSQPAATARPVPTRAPDQVRYVVRRYDSPWAIAERHLGDGTRWREIRDASGRPLDAAHQRPGGSPARIIFPGEVLLLPPGGSTSHLTQTRTEAPVHPTSAPTPAAAPASAAGKTGTAGTAGTAGKTGTAGTAGTAGKTGWSANTGPAATAGTTGTAGSPAPAPAAALQPPAHPAPAPANASPATTTSTAAPVASPLAAATTAPFPAPTTWADPPGPTPAGSTSEGASTTRSNRAGPASSLLEAGLVGAAALGVIGVLRQRQAQRRPFGKRIRLPGPDLARAELALRGSERPERAALISRALESLIGLLGDAPFPPPTIFGLVAEADAVEVLLDLPASPPSPWTASAEGFRWRILSTDLSPAPPVEPSAPLPALVSLGRAASGSADVLINLEAAGVVGITGRRDQALGLMHAMATHLLGAPWAEAVSLILIGFPSGLVPAASARTAASVTEVIAELRATAEIMTALIARNGCADAFQARVRGLAGDGWPPVVVLCAERPTGEELALLSAIAIPGSGVAAVVTHAGAASRWEIDVDAEPVPVHPLRLAVEPTILDHADITNLVQLARIAEDDSGATVADPPYDRIQLSVESVDSQDLGTGLTLAERLSRIDGRGDADQLLPLLPEPEVLVGVLGSVEITGARDFKRPKSRELVVYLAMHPHGVGEAELDEALWGCHTGRVVSAATRDSTVSAARSAIGGAARLLPAQGQGREKRYQLGPEVGSDWSKFCILHRWGREQRSTRALRQALELVRGRPFEAVVSGRTYGWIHTEGHGRHIEAEVADAADLAAGLYLEQGDLLSARWAARRGLIADPYTERLWVRLMEAADGLGESQEIERIMDEMDVVLELDGDFSGLHPNTLGAYDRLSRRHRISAGESGA